jgi:adenylate cyclase
MAERPQAPGDPASSPALTTVVRRFRKLLPGDERFGDPLSTAGDSQASVIGRQLADATAERPSLLREAGLTALQVWEALSSEGDAQPGTSELAIVFTDLVNFSKWALEAGDGPALALLRDVGEAIEPPVRDNSGRVVKRLGDGMMAVFEDPRRGLAAIFEARERLDRVEAPGYVPGLRAGMHFGRPKQLGGDVFGVDVNAAARLTEHARANEVLVSDAALAELDTSGLRVRRKRLFRAKGVPSQMQIYSVQRK